MIHTGIMHAVSNKVSSQAVIRKPVNINFSLLNLVHYLTAESDRASSFKIPKKQMHNTVCGQNLGRGSRGRLFHKKEWMIFAKEGLIQFPL